jgi:hypothetical protein
MEDNWEKVTEKEDKEEYRRALEIQKFLKKVCDIG